jgi:hypothetical protein
MFSTTLVVSTWDPQMTDLKHEWLKEDAHEGIAEGSEVGHVVACDVFGPSMTPTMVDDTFGVVHASGQHPLVGWLPSLSCRCIVPT